MHGPMSATRCAARAAAEATPERSRVRNAPLGSSPSATAASGYKSHAQRILFTLGRRFILRSGDHAKNALVPGL